MNCIISALENKKYITLGLWGKLVFLYVVEEALKSHVFDTVYIATNSDYIRYIVKHYKLDVVFVDQIDSNSFVVNANTALIMANYLVEISSQLDLSHSRYIEEYLHDVNMINVDSANNFELALVLLQKRRRGQIIRKSVLQRIQEKEILFNVVAKETRICLLGHSQFDFWDVEIDLDYKALFILIGINDIVNNDSVQKVVKDICELIGIVQDKTKAPIFYLERPINVKWVSTKAFDDSYGKLNIDYTIDGLHLNKEGYSILNTIIETELGEINHEKNSNYSCQIRF